MRYNGREQVEDPPLASETDAPLNSAARARSRWQATPKQPEIETMQNALNGEIIEPSAESHANSHAQNETGNETPKRGPGRPVGTGFIPTDEQRRIVEAATSAGLDQQTIAGFFQIGRDTLRKHFAKELAMGKFKADLTIGQNYVALAKKEDFRAAPLLIHYTKTQMGWNETARLEVTGKDGGPIQHDLSRLTDDELELLLRLREKMTPALPSPTSETEIPTGESHEAEPASPTSASPTDSHSDNWDGL